MRVYHGTVEAFLPAIQSEGLKYTPAHSFKMTSMFGDALRIEPGVYVASDRKGAEMMAYVKAIYLKTPNGHIVPGTAIADWKESDIMIRTRPAIIELELPEDYASKLKRDRQWGDSETGFIFMGSIPASFIVNTEVLENDSPV